MSIANPIGRSTFKELLDTAGDEFVVELVDTFLVEGPCMLQALRDALATAAALKELRHG